MNHKRLLTQLGILAGGVVLASNLVKEPAMNLPETQTPLDPYTYSYSIIFKCMAKEITSQSSTQAARIIIGDTAGIISQGVLNITLNPLSVQFSGDDLAKENTEFRTTTNGDITVISVRDNNGGPEFSAMHEVGQITVDTKSSLISCTESN